MRNRNTIEYLGIWETLYNPDFKPIEFDRFRNEAGLNAFTQQIAYVYANEADVLNVALFGITAKQWRDANTDLEGNVRDYTTINELICLSNMESLNSVFINENMPQRERLVKLNQIAIQQMSVLHEVENRKLLK